MASFSLLPILLFVYLYKQWRRKKGGGGGGGEGGGREGRRKTSYKMVKNVRKCLIGAKAGTVLQNVLQNFSGIRGK